MIAMRVKPIVVVLHDLGVIGFGEVDTGLILGVVVVYLYHISFWRA